MWPVPEKGATAQIGLAVEGRADQKDMQAIKTGDMVLGQIEQGGPWVAE